MAAEPTKEHRAPARVDRRTLLRSGLTVAALGGPFAGFVSACDRDEPRYRIAGLVPVRDGRDGVVRLHLPDGFEYRSFHHTAERVELDDGTELPGRHDGMGAFDDGDGLVLVRNHEVDSPGQLDLDAYAAFGPGDLTPYDPAARGGTTTVHVDRHGRVGRAYTSLHGTLRNCSGGIMPWGAWVTCEETVSGPDVSRDFGSRSNKPLQRRHGYVFEVPAGGRVTDPVPIRAAGRFSHEAVAFEPTNGHLYLTEDNHGFASGFYRYTPPNDALADRRIEDGGVLDMLAVAARPNAHLEGQQDAGATYEVGWVRIDRPDFGDDSGPATRTDGEAGVYVAEQGWEKGAAYFSRLEGQVCEDGVVYFCSTQGGGRAEDDPGPSAGYGNGFGQVWAYEPDGSAGGTLTCVYQSPGPGVLDLPDNVTMSARGTLVLCEDSEGDIYLRGLTREGKLRPLALNRAPDIFDSEFAGSTFSPDGTTLFVNIQDDDGMTFAIWGPWERYGI
jgi:secreted PhoX family phosphatase